MLERGSRGRSVSGASHKDTRKEEGRRKKRGRDENTGNQGACKGVEGTMQREGQRGVKPLNHGLVQGLGSNRHRKEGSIA